MNTIPINYESFDSFIRENHLFERARESCIEVLNNRYRESKYDFIRNFGADITVVLETYRFINSGISFDRHYEFDKPLDTVSVWIRIYNSNNSYVCEYTVYYDFKLEIIDDKMVN